MGSCNGNGRDPACCINGEDGDGEYRLGASAILTSAIRLDSVVEELQADTLRAEALAEGRAFIEKLAAGWMARIARFDRDGETLLAATINGELTGVGGGLAVEAVCFCLRLPLYVRPAWRRVGAGPSDWRKLFSNARANAVARSP